MLHLGPDEVIAGIGHGAIDLGIGGGEHRAAHHLAALHHLDLGRIPDLGARRRIPGMTILPLGHVEGALIDRTGRRLVDGMAVFASLARPADIWTGRWRHCPHWPGRKPRQLQTIDAKPDSRDQRGRKQQAFHWNFLSPRPAYEA